MTRSSGKRWLRTLALFLLPLAAARFTNCSLALFWARRSHLTDLISAMLPPDWGYAPRILSPLLATVQMSVTGTALGSFLALLLAPLCAENLHAPKPLRWTLRLLVQVLRSFPTLILALLATFLFGLGTFSGTVAITVYTFAILTRLTYEDIESAELAPYHALCAMGAVPAKVYWRAVVPGIAPSYFSNVLYLLETNVRHSSILGYVGAGGIGLLLNEKISWLEYGKVGMILFGVVVGLACVTTAIALTSSAAAYFAELCRGKVPYKAFVIAICVFSAVVSNLGLDRIVAVAAPVLDVIYPPTLVLIFISLLMPRMPDRVSRGACIGALITSVLCTLTAHGINIPVVPSLPLYDLGLSWLIPAAVFGLAASLLPFRARSREKRIVPLPNEEH